VLSSIAAAIAIPASSRIASEPTANNISATMIIIAFIHFLFPLSFSRTLKQSAEFL